MQHRNIPDCTWIFIYYNSFSKEKKSFLYWIITFKLNFLSLQIKTLTPVPFPRTTPVVAVTFFRSDQSVSRSGPVVLTNFTVSVRRSRPRLIPFFYVFFVHLPGYRWTAIRTTPAWTIRYTTSMLTWSTLFLCTAVIILFIIFVRVSIFFCMRILFPFTYWWVRITILALFCRASAHTPTATSARGPVNKVTLRNTGSNNAWRYWLITTYGVNDC